MFAIRMGGAELAALDRRRRGRHGWARVAALLEFGFLGALPVLLISETLVRLAIGWQGHAYMIDLQTFLGAGRDVLAGRSPYPVADRQVLALGQSFVYPAPAALAMVPLALLPAWLASALWTLALLAAIPAALWIVGVRDWRCFGTAFLSIWAINAIVNGTISPLLMLGMSALWVYRDRPRVAPWLLALLVCTKLFLWPVALWLVATRRAGSAVRGALLAVGLSLASWWVIGYDSLLAYPHLLHELGASEQAVTYSPLALALAAGLSPAAAWLAVAALAGAVCLAAVALRKRSGHDRSVFTLAIVASFVLSPIVWLHYFLLLLVPLGIKYPRFGLVWLLPLLSWAAIGAHSSGILAIASALTVAAVVTLAAVLAPRFDVVRRPGLAT